MDSDTLKWIKDQNESSLDDPEVRTRIREIHIELFGKKIRSGCKNCLIAGYLKIRENLLIKKSMKDQKFVLKEGIVLQVFKTSEQFTRDGVDRYHLSDKRAAELIKENKAFEQFFEKLGGKETSEETYSIKIGEETKEMTRDGLIAELKKLEEPFSNRLGIKKLGKALQIRIDEGIGS